MQYETQTLKTNFRSWLQQELVDRCKKNQSYSLRAFAYFLEVEPSALSQIISGKRKASTKVITRICNKLAVSPMQTQAYIDSAKSKSGKASTEMNQKDSEFSVLAEDVFAYIANWYYVAILELSFVPGFCADPNWIAKTLSIKKIEAVNALERLQRLGLLREENANLVKTNKLLTNFVPGFTSAANKEFQRQLIGKALDAIDSCPQEEKDITSITMAVDERKIPEARKLIAKFRRDMANFLEDGEQTRVYNLGVQLHPISKKQSEEEKI